MPSRDKDIFAAELALGVLDADERAEALRLRQQDRNFDAAVEEWESVLAPLAETVPEVAPPSSLLNRIEARLAGPGRAPVGIKAEVASRIERLTASLAAWRMAAAGAAAAAVLLAIAWFGGIQPPLGPGAPAERYIAVLQGDSGKAGFLVTMRMDDKQFVIHPIVSETPPAKSYELWLLMKDDTTPPKTLGLVGTEAYAMMDAPPEVDDEQLKKGIRLAISLEPEGGAPSGQSMGPIVFAGDLVREAH